MKYRTPIAARAARSHPLLPTALLVASLCSVIGDSSAADETNDERFAVHAQATNVTQTYGSFSAAYSGQNSLKRQHDTQETSDLTLYTGWRPWHGAEMWVNVEVDQGFGLSNTLGVAGFPSGEAYKVGANAPP
jgi:high affinity Mn2+ porin